MILGILSDSHGRHERVAAALRLLEKHGAERFVHCGDIGGERVLDELAGRPVSFVWGNADYPEESLIAYARRLGLSPPAEVPLRLEVGGSRLCVFHGHETAYVRLVRWLENDDFERAAKSLGALDYVLHGHTHVASDVRLGRVRFINPGALQRAAEYTVATLDVARDDVKFLSLDDAG